MGSTMPLPSPLSPTPRPSSALAASDLGSLMPRAPAPQTWCRASSMPIATCPGAGPSRPPQRNPEPLALPAPSQRPLAGLQGAPVGPTTAFPTRPLSHSPQQTSQQQVRRPLAAPAAAGGVPGSFTALDEEFSSAQGVAQGLFLRYRRVQEEGYRGNLKDFARAGMAAYALGWTEEGLRKELALRLLPHHPHSAPSPMHDPTSPLGQGPASSLEPGPPSAQSPSMGVDGAPRELSHAEPGWADREEVGAGSSLEGREGQGRQREGEGEACDMPPAAKGVSREEVEECLLCLTLVFVTLECIPPGLVRRWSTVKPVSAEALLQWRGFCSIISRAYYDQGMAWYSIPRLQMEQMVVSGRAEPSAVVADRMRLVFTTLEAVDPRWGGLNDFPTL